MWATASVHSCSSKPQWKYQTTKGAFSLWTCDECRLPPGASPRMCFWALRVVTCCFATRFAHMFHRSHWSFQQLEWSSIRIKEDISLTPNFSIAWWWNFPGPPRGQLHHIFFLGITTQLFVTDFKTQQWWGQVSTGLLNQAACQCSYFQLWARPWSMIKRQIQDLSSDLTRAILMCLLINLRTDFCPLWALYAALGS